MIVIFRYHSGIDFATANQNFENFILTVMFRIVKNTQLPNFSAVEQTWFFGLLRKHGTFFGPYVRPLLQFFRFMILRIILECTDNPMLYFNTFGYREVGFDFRIWGKKLLCRSQVTYQGSKHSSIMFNYTILLIYKYYQFFSLEIMWCVKIQNWNWTSPPVDQLLL